MAPGGRARLAGVLLLLALLAQGATALLGPDVLGMADNGDFWRVTAPAGLRNPAPVATLRHRFVQPTYLRVRPDDRVGQSSASLLARAAMSLPGGSEETFDLRRMGALMLGLATALLALAALRADGAAIFGCVAFAWVLTDPAYLLFFNSFYADGAALLGILGSATILCVRGPPPSRATLGLLLTCAFAIAWSKQAHVASALPVAAALLTIGGKRPTPRIWVSAALCVLVTAGAAYHFTRGAGPSFPQINNYNTVFNGIGPSTRDPEHALRALGVGSEWRGRVGTSYFEEPVPASLARQLETLSRVRLASLYATDPIALAAVLRRAQRSLTMPHRYLGNYPRSPENAEPRVHRVPWSFDGLREPLLRHPAAFWTWWLAVGAVTAIIARRQRWTSGPWTAAAFLWMTMAVETTAAILGDGLFALSRHLLVARFASDLLLALVLAAAVELTLRRLRGWPT